MADNLSIENIHEKLADDDFVVFAGAGIVAGTGIPDSWKELLVALGKESGIDTVGKCEEDYPDIAQEIYEKMVQHGKEQRYDEIINESLSPTEAPYSVSGMEIVDTTKWVVTTNFDNIIEASFRRIAEIRSETCKINIRSLPRLDVDRRSAKEKLTYLHGSAHTNYIILRRDQYDNYYPSVSGKNGPRCLENYLEYVYKNRTIVFVGFSFLDRYIRECFKNIYARISWQDEDAARRFSYQKIMPKIPRHYALIRKPREDDYEKRENYKKRLNIYEEIKRDLELINIRVVWYDNHIDWIECFKKIRDSRKRKKQIAGKTRKRSDAKQIL